MNIVLKQPIREFSQELIRKIEEKQNKLVAAYRLEPDWRYKVQWYAYGDVIHLISDEAGVEIKGEVDLDVLLGEVDI